MLWNGGISFGGVVAFIFADLIILPILVIYRKYYGTRMMLFILGTFYVTMVARRLRRRAPLRRARPGPDRAPRQGGRDAAIQWNYTTVLNIVALVVAAALVLPLRPHRRHAHAQDDGRRTRHRRPSRSSRARRAVTPTLTGPACRAELAVRGAQAPGRSTWNGSFTSGGKETT